MRHLKSGLLKKQKTNKQTNKPIKKWRGSRKSVKAQKTA